MGRSLGGSQVHGSASHSSVRVPVSADLMAQMEALPDKHYGGNRREWTAEMDAALLRYWDVKPQRLVAKALGVSEGTARSRVQELREAGRA